MISAHGVTVRFGSRNLFEEVNVKFTPGNCYGLIGANGAGKSTFLKVLSGEIQPTVGSISIGVNQRLAVLKQDHFQFDDSTALQTVIMGHARLCEVIAAKDAIYSKEHFSDADGIKASELEGEFAELNGWGADSEAASLLKGLGVKDDLHGKTLRELTGSEKIKVLLAQSLFGQPDILLLDEPTNHLDLEAIQWLENFLYEFKNTVIVVSHDRHFLNKVCTHMADIDFGKIQIYAGNYDFWYTSSQLALKLTQDRNKKVEEKTKELEAFIARFSANASKSRQATSRQRQLEKLTLEDIRPSSRKYPYVHFKAEREAGKNLLNVENLSMSLDGEPLFNKLNFTVNKGDKIVFVGKNELAATMLFKILQGEQKAQSGQFQWGVTTTRSYFPKENQEYFQDENLNLIDWLRQYSADQSENYIRGFLGRMLFSGDETLKKARVLSGGERVRCMLARMMLTNANVVILDEPTNHLDLESITAVNNALTQFDGTVLFTSHDFEFIRTVANRVIEISAEAKGFARELPIEQFLADRP